MILLIKRMYSLTPESQPVVSMRGQRRAAEGGSP